VSTSEVISAELLCKLGWAALAHEVLAGSVVPYR